METHEFRYPMGIQVRDKVTGFVGIVVHRADFITGCDQYGLRARSVDNKPGEFLQIDETQVEIMDAKPLILQPVEAPQKAPPPGGPQMNVSRV